MGSEKRVEQRSILVLEEVLKVIFSVKDWIFIVLTVSYIRIILSDTFTWTWFLFLLFFQIFYAILPALKLQLWLILQLWLSKSRKARLNSTACGAASDDCKSLAIVDRRLWLSTSILCLLWSSWCIRRCAIWLLINHSICVLNVRVDWCLGGRESARQSVGDGKARASGWSRRARVLVLKVHFDLRDLGRWGVHHV